MSNSDEQNNICYLFTIMTSNGRVETQVAVIGAGVSGLIVGKYVNQVFTHRLNDTVVWPLSSVLIRILIIHIENIIRHPPTARHLFNTNVFVLPCLYL